MRIPLVILLSLATNLVLAMVWFRLDHSVPAKARDVAVSATSATPAQVQSNAPADGESGLASQSSWSDLQTEDLKEFVRRLRACGCPEETIKDLVLAELNRRYTLKQQAIWKNDFKPEDYWKPFKPTYDPVELKKNRERSRQFQDLQKVKSALIVQLFGVDVERERRKQEGFDPSDWGWNPFGNLSYLPESKRDTVQQYLDEFQDKLQEFYASAQGGWDADARRRQKELEQEKLAGLAQILTPQELREYELRNSQAAQQISSDLHGVDLTREQYEALFDIRSKYGDSIYNYVDTANDPGAVKQIEQNKQDMQAEIAAALGADTAQQLERAQDYNFSSSTALPITMISPPALPRKSMISRVRRKQPSKTCRRTLI